MSEHSTPLTKAELMYRFDKQIEEVKIKGETSTGHGEAFEGKWVDDELILWDNHIAWENKLHAKLSFVEASSGSVVKITYKHREGMLIKIGVLLAVFVFIWYQLYDIDFALAMMFFVVGCAYELYRQYRKRKVIEQYVTQTIEA